MEKLAINGGKPVRDRLLPYGRHTIDAQDIKAVTDTLRSDYLTTGPKIKEFEEKIANHVGVTYAVAFSSGTAALHGAAAAAEFGLGHEVITTPLSFAATANCLLYQQATPVFVDVSSKTLNLSYTCVLRFIQRNYTLVNGQLINNRTRRCLKGIIPVHFAGHPVNLEKFKKLADKYDLTLIEDAAHAFEAQYFSRGKWHRIGSCKFSDVTIFSFHPVKHITTGEGGIVTTNNKRLYHKLLRFRSHGITRDPDLLQKPTAGWNNEMQSLGFNYRMSDINASLGISQLKKSQEFLKKRIRLVSSYLYELSDLTLITLPLEQKWARSAWHIFVIRLNLKKLTASRDEIYKALQAENIGVNVHYMPIYKHPYYAKSNLFISGPMKNAEKAFSSIITLPLYPTMSEQDAEDVMVALVKVLRAFSANPAARPT